MKIGENLKKLRLQSNKTQQDLAEYLNISRQAYCRYENDQREISLDTLCKLADLYDESTDYILGRKEF